MKQLREKVNYVFYVEYKFLKKASKPETYG